MFSRRVAVVLFVVYASIALIGASTLSSTFSESDRSRAAASISSKGFAGSAEATFYSAAALAGLKGTAPSSFCGNAATGLRSATESNEFETVYYTLRAMKAAGCTVAEDQAAAVRGAVSDQLEDAADAELLQKQYLLGSLELTSGKNADVEVSSIEAVVEATLDAYDDDSGVFGEDADDEEAMDLSATAASLRILASAYKLAGSNLDDDMLEALVSVSENLKTACGHAHLSRYTGGVVSASFSTRSESRTALAAAADFFDGVAAFSGALDIEVELDADVVVGFSEFFVRCAKNAVDANEEAVAATGLYALAGLPVGTPLVVSLENTSFRPSSKEKEVLRATVTDAFGNAVAKATVLMVSATKLGQSDVSVVSEHELESQKNGVFTMDFLALRPEFGTYSAEFQVDGPKGFLSIHGARRTLKVYAASVEVSDVRVRVSGDSDPQASAGAATHTVSYPTTLDTRASAGLNDYVHVFFRLRSAAGKFARVSQTSVRFQNAATGASSFVPAVIRGKNYYARVAVADLGGVVEADGGAVSVSILVGDAALEKSIAFVALNMDVASLQHDDGVDRRPPEVVYDMVKEYDTFPLAKLPTINHVFRAPERRAPWILSQSFTIAVVAAFALLLVLFMRAGANLRMFPLSPIPAVSALAFIGILGLILVLFMTFWVKMSLMTLAHCLWPLVIGAYFFGSITLRDLAARSEKEKAE